MSNFTYIVIEDHDSSRLIKKVNAMIVAGWHMQGGVAFNAVNGLCLQAIVMYFSEGKHE